MKALILAAGTGSRLYPLTADRPKTMLEILGFPLIYYQIQGLLRHGIQEICLVTGYQQEVLIHYILLAFPGQRFTFLYNPFFRDMNNIYSFYLAAQYCSESDMLILNSDVFCEPDLLREAVYSPLDILLVDGEKEFSAEATKVRLDERSRVIEVSKEISLEQSQGEYIGIMKLSKGSCQLLHDKVRELLYQGQSNWWFVYALNELLARIPVSPVFTRGRVWEEIDSPLDYSNAIHLAEKMVRGKKHLLNGRSMI
ncbi:MAG TPA: phosphocholine cytidylyltransferase family protein [Syntrophomonadaceae bacterium]|nr:phosphocholine cytidylyltransferase family protein [Syntrophomonadaceae bacterium]